MSLVEQYFFSDRERRPQEAVTLFCQSEVVQGMLNGPKWGRKHPLNLPLVRIDRDLLGYKLTAEVLPSTTPADFLKPPLDWEAFLADYQQVRTALVGFAAARWSVYLEHFVSISSGSIVSRDDLAVVMADMRSAAMSKRIAAGLTPAQLSHLLDPWYKACEVLDPLVNPNWIEAEIQDEDEPVLDSIFDKRPIFQVSPGTFHPRMTHCAGRTLGLRCRAALIELFEPLDAGKLVRR